MPGLMSHIAFGQMYAEAHPGVETAAFVRGATFPDIRLITRWPRERTHWNGTTLERVAAVTGSWQAGMEFHNWLDDAWNEYFFAYGLVFGRPEDESSWLALKLMAEHEAYRELHDHDELTRALRAWGEYELTFGASEEEIKCWYGAMSRHLASLPSETSWRTWLRDLGFRHAHFYGALQRLEVLQSDAEWRRRVSDCHARIKERVSI